MAVTSFSLSLGTEKWLPMPLKSSVRVVVLERWRTEESKSNRQPGRPGGMKNDGGRVTASSSGTKSEPKYLGFQVYSRICRHRGGGVGHVYRSGLCVQSTGAVRRHRYR